MYRQTSMPGIQKQNDIVVKVEVVGLHLLTFSVSTLGSLR